MIGDDGFFLDFGFNADETSHQKVVYMIEDVRKRMSTIADKEFGLSFNPDMAKFTAALKQAFQYAWNSGVIPTTQNMATGALLGLPIDAVTSLRKAGESRGVNLLADVEARVKELSMITTQGQLDATGFIARSHLKVDGSAFLKMARENPMQAYKMLLDASYQEMASAFDSGDVARYQEAYLNSVLGVGPNVAEYFKMNIAGTTAATRPKTIADTLYSSYSTMPAQGARNQAEAFEGRTNAERLVSNVQSWTQDELAGLAGAAATTFTKNMDALMSVFNPKISGAATGMLSNVMTPLAPMSDYPIGSLFSDKGKAQNELLGMQIRGTYAPGRQEELSSLYQSFVGKNYEQMSSFERNVWNVVVQAMQADPSTSSDAMRMMLAKIYHAVYANLKGANAGKSKEELEAMTIQELQKYRLKDVTGAPIPGTLDFPSLYKMAFPEDKERGKIERGFEDATRMFYELSGSEKGVVPPKRKESERSLQGALLDADILNKRNIGATLDAISGRALAYAGSSSEVGRSSLDIDLRINGERAMPTIVTGTGKTAVSSALDINRIMQG